MLAPVLDGSLCGVRRVRMVTAMLLEARARDALGDQVTAGRVLERALDVTESNGILLPFLLDPAPALLERPAPHRTPRLDLPDPGPAAARGARGAGGPGGFGGTGFPPRAGGVLGGSSPGLTELTDSETRVLRYLPTHLTVPEIAAELCVSVNTVSTHTHHLYAKFGVHSRHEAVGRARALGLLAPSARRA